MRAVSQRVTNGYVFELGGNANMTGSWTYLLVSVQLCTRLGYVIVDGTSRRNREGQA